MAFTSKELRVDVSNWREGQTRNQISYSIVCVRLSLPKLTPDRNVRARTLIVPDQARLLASDYFFFLVGFGLFLREVSSQHSSSLLARSTRFFSMFFLSPPLPSITSVRPRYDFAGVHSVALVVVATFFLSFHLLP